MLVETPQDERVRHVQAIITETLEKDDELQRFVDCPAQKHGSAILACLFSDRRRNGKRKTFQQSSSWMAQLLHVGHLHIPRTPKVQSVYSMSRKDEQPEEVQAFVCSKDLVTD